VTRTFPDGTKRRIKIARNFPYEMHRTVTSRKMRFAKYTVEYTARKEDKTDAGDLEKNLSWLVIKIENSQACTRARKRK